MSNALDDREVEFEMTPDGLYKVKIMLSDEDRAKAERLADQAGLELPTYLRRVIGEELRRKRA